MAAALFALHPLNVESVAWIAERKNLLSMLFFLLTLAAYRWYISRPGFWRYALMALLFALGLMAKPQIVTLPFVLLLWDYWPLGRMQIGGRADIPQRKTLWWLLHEKLALFLLAAASAVITVKAQRAGGAVTSLVQHPLTLRIENAIVSYARYVAKSLWPLHLAPMYPYPVGGLPAWQVLGALILLAVITAVVVRYRQQRYLLAGWLWFVGTLVPMIGLVQVGSQAMADRYAYLPCIGLFIAICWGIADWAKQRHLPKAVLPIASAAVLVALAIVARRQLEYWRDNVTLWSHTVGVTSLNYIAEDNLGAALLERGQLDEAMQHFRTALAIDPADPTSLLKIAMYEQQRKNWPAAIQRYSELLSVAGNPLLRARALTNLGWAYRDDGDFEQAWNSWQQAIALDPHSARAWVGLGLLAQGSGDLDRAVKNYSHAVELEPSDVAYLLLAQALQQTARAAEAQAARDQARKISRNLDQAQRAVADMLRR